MTDLLDGPEIVEVDASGNVIDDRKGRGKLADDFTNTDLVAECRDSGIEEWAIRAGGDYRQGSTKTIYWLPLEDLLDFEKADASIAEDYDFWDWFDKFLDERKLETKSEHTQKKTRTWDDWSPSHWAGEANKKIGKWWNDWGYNSSGSSGSELTRQLAVALKAIGTTVSVINDTDHRYRVQLSADTDGMPMSYTAYDERLISVSPQALLDTTIEQDVGVEITSGWALHEASHVKYSMSLREALTDPTKLQPMSVAGLLHNLLEDMRIEYLTSEKFPGFAEFFQTANDYLWDKQSGDGVPQAWGPSLQEKVNSVILMGKWPTEYKPTVDADPGLTTEWPWWRAWAEGYVAGKEPIRMAIIRALARLAEDEQTKEEMDKLTEEEELFEKQNYGYQVGDEEFEALMKGLKELLDKGGDVFDPCPSPGQAGQPIQLTVEQGQELQRLINEQYQQFEAFYQMQIGTDGVAPIIEVSKPIEDQDSRYFYKKAGAMAERMRSVFFFRKKIADETERLLRTGFVDEEELWRAGTGDPRVFERVTQPEDTYASVTMLVDASGSMSGRGLEKAQELANVMMVCLRLQNGVRTRVRAHTTGAIDGSQTSRIFRIWDPGDPDTRLGLLQTIDHGSNFDGFAIDWCAKELNDTAQPNEEKLLIVLSDGLPAGSIVDPTRGYIHYGGDAAMDHMKLVSEGWGRKGVHIVQIAIDHDGIRPEDQARMFKHWIGYENDSKLLIDMTKLLARTFGGVE